MRMSGFMYAVHVNIAEHPAGTALTFDWSVCSFMMVVCENYLVVLWTENSDRNIKKIFIDNHYKSIPGPVRSEYSSCRVPKRIFTFSRKCSWNRADNVIRVSNFVSRLNVI